MEIAGAFIKMPDVTISSLYLAVVVVVVVVMMIMMVPMTVLTTAMTKIVTTAIKLS